MTDRVRTNHPSGTGCPDEDRLGSIARVRGAKAAGSAASSARKRSTSCTVSTSYHVGSKATRRPAINHPTSGLCDFIGRQATYGAIEPYKTFLTGFVIPNIQLVGWGVYLMELAVPVSLIFGILTRLGGLLGAIQGINLAIGFVGVPQEWIWTYIFLVLLNLMFVAVGAGRMLGVNHWLRRRFEGQSGLVGRFVRLTT